MTTAAADTTIVGCACTPAWPELVVHRDDGITVTVLPADTPGPLAHLYNARCGVTAASPTPDRSDSRPGPQYPAERAHPDHATTPSWAKRCPTSPHSANR